MSTLNKADIPAELHQCHQDDTFEQPIFRIETAEFNLWIIAHRLVSANLARREALVQSVNTACQQIDENKQHHLLIVSDHWFDRSKASKEIPAWWLGQLPVNVNDYLADGIRLQECANTLPYCLQHQYLLSGGHHQIHHPLKRNGSDKTVHRYLLLTAYYQLQ